jgi:hypothetical protein
MSAAHQQLHPRPNVRTLLSGCGPRHRPHRRRRAPGEQVVLSDEGHAFSAGMSW